VTEHFQIDIDDAAEIIRVAGYGFWTIEILDRHFDRLRSAIAGRRSQWRAIRVLVNLQKAEIQPAEVIERIDARTRQIYDPGDRVAIVVTSSLAKLQMRRGITRLQHDFFISEHAAVTWLRAHDRPLRSANEPRT
jgi:hypothetical protein